MGRGKWKRGDGVGRGVRGGGKGGCTGWGGVSEGRGWATASTASATFEVFPFLPFRAPSPPPFSPYLGGPSPHMASLEFRSFLFEISCFFLFFLFFSFSLSRLNEIAPRRSRFFFCLLCLFFFVFFSLSRLDEIAPRRSFFPFFSFSFFSLSYLDEIAPRRWHRRARLEPSGEEEVEGARVPRSHATLLGELRPLLR